MINKKNKAFKINLGTLIIGFILIAAALSIVLVIRITNLDMTEGRLFVTYWKQWILMLILILAGNSLINWSLRHK